MNFDEARLKALGFNTVSDLMDHYENVVIGLIAVQDIAIRNAHKANLAVESSNDPHQNLATVAVASMNAINTMHDHVASILTRRK